VVNRTDFNKTTVATEEFALDATNNSLSYCSSKKQFLSRKFAGVNIFC
jgi:hypothetical protein